MFAQKPVPLIPIALSLRLPTAAELVALAVANTDFPSAICTDSRLMAREATYAAELAAEGWETAREAPAGTVPPALIAETSAALLEYAAGWLRRLERDERDARADMIDAGDCDRDGDLVPYAAYRSAVA